MDEQHWTNTSSVSTPLTLEVLEKHLAEWKAMRDRQWFQFIEPPKLEPPKEPWPLFFSDLSLFYQPVKQAMMLLLATDCGPPVELHCAWCRERLEPGSITYFCGETCEHAFRERYPDLELPDLLTEKARRLVEVECPEAD